MTSRAAAVLHETRAMKGVGGRIAVRICASHPSSPNSGSCGRYRLRFAAEPFPDDVVITSAGGTVFLAAGVADRLAASILDAENTGVGNKLVLKHRRSPEAGWSTGGPGS